MTDIDQLPKTDNPDQPGRRRPARLAVIALVAVLALGEAGARILEPRFPSIASWGSDDLDEKAQAMVELEGTGADVVFMGSSAVNRGFDDELFADVTGLSAFNAAIDGSSPRLLEVFIEEVVEPTLNPDVVIIGLTSRAFNDNALTQQELFELYLNSDGRAEWLGSASAKQRLETFAAQYSAFLRVRPFLRNPKQLLDAIRGVNPDPAPETTDPPYEVNELWATRMADRSLTAYEIGDVELGALARTVDRLAAEGVKVVLVDLPVVEDDWAALHPNGVADINAFHEALAAFAAERAVDLVDTWEETWPVDQFRDPVHLNQVGQARLTRLLADYLADAQ
jgi:lysophospholipase L1-like esterase